MTAQDVAERIEKNQGKDDDGAKSEYAAAHKEVYELLKKDEDGTLRKSLNEQFHDSTNKNDFLGKMELVGYDDKDGDLRFKDSKGNFVDVDSQGNRKAILGADKDGNNGREFTTDAQGNITSYTVKKGDTVWSIAETICNERNKGTDKKVTAQDIQAESKKLTDANPELKNPDKIYEGKTTIKVSTKTSEEITEKRNPEAKTEKSKEELETDVQLAKRALDRFNCENRSFFTWGLRVGYSSMTQDDIDTALKRKDLTAEDKRGLEFLKKHYSELESDCTLYTNAVYYEGLDKYREKALQEMSPTKNNPCETKPTSNAMTDADRQEMYKNVNDFGQK